MHECELVCNKQVQTPAPLQALLKIPFRINKGSTASYWKGLGAFSSRGIRIQPNCRREQWTRFFVKAVLMALPSRHIGMSSLGLCGLSTSYTHLIDFWRLQQDHVVTKVTTLSGSMIAWGKATQWSLTRVQLAARDMTVSRDCDYDYCIPAGDLATTLSLP